MRRMPTRSHSPRRVAQELAELVRDRGGGPVAVLAALGPLLVPDKAALAQRVAALPPDARAVWTEALQFSGPLARDFDRERLSAEIMQIAQPVRPEGYLFELLLRALDRDRSHRRGVYYTPQPLVSFVVRAVARLAGEHFPDRPLQVIDPACGYGAFLLYSRDFLLYSRDQWSRSIDPSRPPVAAVEFTGFEICPITWAAAHLLLAASPETQAPLLLNVNPLTAGESLQETILGPPDRPIVPLIVGNPPWSNFGRLNRSPWLDELLVDYRTGLVERKANLTDDAIKFIRWGQYWIDRARAGILAFVTPSTWLSGLTHRRMRQSLLASFDDVLVVDLHGQLDGPAGDENVFGVRSGVAIVVMVKRGRNVHPVVAARHVPGTQYSVLSTQDHPSNVRRVDLVGSTPSKFAAIADESTIYGEHLVPSAPDFSLGRAGRPRNFDYAAFWPLNRIFRHYISGVQTKNDAVFVGFTSEELEVQVREWMATQPAPPAFDAQFIRPYLVAPFDRRWIYYDPRLLGRPRLAVMRHMLRPNLGLVFMRQSTCPGEYDHFLAVDCLVSDRVFYSRHGAPFLAPLWLDCIAATSGRDCIAATSGREEVSPKLEVQLSGAESNFADEFRAAADGAVGTPVEATELFRYLYAVAYSPTYRRVFGDELRRGFPRLPLPADAASFSRLAKLGERLVALHLGKVCPSVPETSLPAANENEPYRVGGYDALRRWQTPRRRRRWSIADEAELARLAAIGRETRRLMWEIDEWGRQDAYPTETGSSA